jgi:hypothetical protein
MNGDENNKLTPERRNDLGNKIVSGILTGVVLFVVGLLVNHAYSEARVGTEAALKAKEMAFENKGEIKALRAEMVSSFNSIKSDLGELKSLLRRAAPYEIRDS